MQGERAVGYRAGASGYLSRTFDFGARVMGLSRGYNCFMPDSTPSTPPVPPEPVKTRAPRGAVNKEYTEGLQKSQLILDAANAPQFNPEIVDGVEITAQFLLDLGNDITSARTFLTAATSARGTKKSSTAEESAAKIALAQALQGIQTRAYQKFHVEQPDRVRDTYFGGTDLFSAADPLLEQIGTSFLQSAPGDALPKVDAARIANLQSLFDAWNAARNTQGSDAGASISNFEQFKVVFEAVEAKRRTIQFAADDDFPYYDATQKAAREAFKLPPKGPFRG